MGKNSQLPNLQYDDTFQTHIPCIFIYLLTMYHRIMSSSNSIPNKKKRPPASLLILKNYRLCSCVQVSRIHALLAMAVIKACIIGTGADSQYFDTIWYHYYSQGITQIELLVKLPGLGYWSPLPIVQITIHCTWC